MKILSCEASLRNFLLKQKHTTIQIFSAFAYSTADFVRGLKARNNSVEVIVGTINAFTDPQFIDDVASILPKGLWVDDRPTNNVHERRAMEAAGMSVQTALTTEEGLARAAGDRFDVIVSDMRRPEGEQAGYDLLKALRARNDATPFIIYAGPANAAQKEEAKALGATARATSANELMELVTKALPG